MDLKVSRGRFLITRMIGCGSFGEVYEGMKIDNGRHVAIKLERTSSSGPELLQREMRVYRRIDRSAVGLPKAYWMGVEGRYTMIIMELLGPNLEELLHHCGRCFSLKTLLSVAEQMVTRLQLLHHMGFIHRDIKPDNFAIGSGSHRDKIYLFDFGLSKFYIDPDTQQHISYDDDKPHDAVGTARYCSRRSHLGIEQSRRDDLESVGYVLVYLHNGRLPWQGLKARNKRQKYDLISIKKHSIRTDKLFENLPRAFLHYMVCVQQIRFRETPDYSQLRQIFRALFFQKRYRRDFTFDWDLNEVDRAEKSKYLRKERGIPDPPEPKTEDKTEE
eukprot:scpid67313/ scgid18546/ Casein kinase I